MSAPSAWAAAKAAETYSRREARSLSLTRTHVAQLELCAEEGGERGRIEDLRSHPRPPSAGMMRAPAAGSQLDTFHRSALDRKSTRLNSSHTVISYAVFCLKKKKTTR